MMTEKIFSRILEAKFLIIITTNDYSYQRTTDGIYVVSRLCLGI